MPERNIRNCNDYFRNREYDHYLMAPPKMTREEFIKDMNKKEDAGIANTGGQTQQQLVEYLASYISNNVGVNPSTGEMGYMPFNNTLKDWLEFDIDKWTPYDLTVSSMVSIIGSRSVISAKKKKKSVITFFPQYNNNGIESSEIRPKNEV